MARAISIIQVNVGQPKLLGRVRDENVYSGIAKRPVRPGTVLWLSLHNLAGDGQADLSVHGGPDKAVYAYPSEHLPLWEEELGHTLGPAPFGENLSTRGGTEAEVCIGDRWRWDGAVLEVCQPRWPCFKLALYRERSDIQLQLKANGRTGWYLRVVRARRGRGRITDRAGGTRRCRTHGQRRPPGHGRPPPGEPGSGGGADQTCPTG